MDNFFLNLSQDFEYIQEYYIYIFGHSFLCFLQNNVTWKFSIFESSGDSYNLIINIQQ